MTKRHPKRRTSAGRFARLPLTVLSTKAVTTLAHSEFRVLVLLAAQYNGRNNGALGITHSQAAINGIVSKHTLYKALTALEDRGLIRETYPASRVPPRPKMFALTWISIDDTSWSQRERLPTHNYKTWEPPPKRKQMPHLKMVREG